MLFDKRRSGSSSGGSGDLDDLVEVPDRAEEPPPHGGVRGERGQVNLGRDEPLLVLHRYVNKCSLQHKLKSSTR